MTQHRLRLREGRCAGEELAEFVRSLARQAGLDPQQVYRLRLAADEITTNIVLHGYGDAGGVVEIEGEAGPDGVRLRIEDSAPPFDPHTHDPGPRLGAADPTEGPEGGFGLYLALRGLDYFAYDYVGGRNLNTLVVRRTSSGGTDGQDGRAGDR
ncbi:anti-sigma regulatory factor (Ser/Thr protein kinase) [Saccharothrix tamanrassetensis]|uniref:Anti-sigma regulatory factor (Ser/Thr protein kinase) n=1 Tax=Saccharothrix tamanrassetensis TaxID=1051531 RepID=A0A841CF42_9PSEU|nr:ATP-binding protein [Saccharothrix tamanrassetensis]MBB5954346.1 anti-sigma regulatory factor (Ser/Thr protein kinase) [Saccharothrix tamanrassetensis]